MNFTSSNGLILSGVLNSTEISVNDTSHDVLVIDKTTGAVGRAAISTNTPAAGYYTVVSSKKFKILNFCLKLYVSHLSSFAILSKILTTRSSFNWSTSSFDNL